MPLNVGVSSVELTEGLDVLITASVSVVGFEPSVDYGGSVSTSNVPEPDHHRVSGTVGPGAGDEIQTVLGTGLTEDDLPETILVTFALDEGPGAGEQEQVRVEIDQEGDGDGLSAGDIAIATAGVAALAFGVSRLNRFRQGLN